MTEFREEIAVKDYDGAVIPPDAFPEITVYHEKGNAVMRRSQQLQVVDDATFEDAAVGVQKIKEYMEGIEAKRKFFVQPLNDQVHKINMLFKGLYDPFKNAREILTGKMAAWERMQREARAAEERKRLAELQEQMEAAKNSVSISDSKKLAKEIEKQQKAVEKAASGKGTKRVTVAGTTVSTASRLEITVVDFDQVPNEYKELSEKKVREAHARNANIQIPGLKLEMVPVIRTGR